MSILEAKTVEEIQACWPAIKVLRPHVIDSTFVARVQQQQKEEGYRLMYIKDEEDGTVNAIMGYRIQNYLFSGKTLYVDDLCTLPGGRGKGHGGALLDYADEMAKKEGCACVTLDSGPTRNDAHRLYLNKRFQLYSYHFQKKV